VIRNEALKKVYYLCNWLFHFMINHPGTTLFLVITLVIFVDLEILAQQASRDTFSTQATDPDAKPDAHKMGPRKKKNLFIIKNNTTGTLYGNPCFKEVSHHFGFEYLVVPEKIPPNTNAFKRNLNNLGVNVLLFFRNGPFWKLRMKKKFENCKYGYGDFVG
jgi:hypothetical protein